MSALTLSGVGKSFGSVPVLTGVDLHVPQGSLTAVLGPSGCGKTTLLRLVAGFLAPDAGTIAFGEQVVAGAGRPVSARDRRVGYVPQEGALFPHLDVADNVLFGLDRRRRRARAALPDLLELVGLDPAVAGRFPHELSGGQQQRAALARALAPAPAVVLLDEPFSSLDAGLRESTGRAVARALRATGATALLVTHDQAEALSLADQVAVLRAGALVQTGTPAQVYQAPADLGVALFVGGAVVLSGTVTGSTVTCALGVLPIDRHAGTPGATGPVQVLLRPEQIELTAHGHAGAPSGVVAEVSYRGPEATVRVRLSGGAQVILARVAGPDAPAAGATVYLSVRGPVPVFAG